MDGVELKKLFRRALVWPIYFGVLEVILGFIVINILAEYDCGKNPDVLCGFGAALTGILFIYAIFIIFYGLLFFYFCRAKKEIIANPEIKKRYFFYQGILLALGLLYLTPIIIFIIQYGLMSLF